MPADNSQTERLRRLRGINQVQGPRLPSDQSTWLSEKFGKMEYTRQTPTGETVTQCCGSGACIVNFDVQNASNPGYSLTINSINNNIITFTVSDEPPNPHTKPITYIQSDITYHSTANVYVNNSNNTLHVIDSLGQIYLTLEPCGAFYAHR